eukprot:TRINITY_DN13801_c0_g2_i1.p1 TRINITY_DN13801_c0_g2~~TRINITY_DN13801_c0_g2_i1.p1  ORF type:complete len:1053 (-),score=157.67 TRINITY_DN13801_c0_g2_i1:381-3539(-)
MDSNSTTLTQPRSLPPQFKGQAQDDVDQQPEHSEVSPAHVKQVPPEVEGMLTMLGIAQGRCGLLAGFTYYELSRQGNKSVDWYPAYVFLLLVAFSLAVVCAALATFLRVYMRRIHFSAWREYSSRVMGVAKFAYSLFILASLVWIVALSCMGMVYNSQDYGELNVMIGTFAFPAVLLTKLPFYVLLPTCGMCFLYVSFLTVLSTGRKTATRLLNCPVTGLFLNDLAQQDMDGVKRAADTTMYLLGFTGASLARYRDALTRPGEALAHEVLFNIIFWCCTIFAAALLALVMVCGTHTYVVFARLPCCARDYVHSKIKHMLFLMTYTVKLALILVVFSGMFIGWGCSDSCVKVHDNFMMENVKACYAQVAAVPAVIGGLGFLFTLWLTYRIRRANHHAVREVMADCDDLKAEGKTGEDWQSHLTDDGTAAAAMADTWASQASLFSGFVYYNLACFDSDIIQGPLTADFILGVTRNNVVFLFVTMISFSFGMAIVTIASTVQMERQLVLNTAVSLVFADKLRPIIWNVGILHQLALHGFMCSFALIGFVKMVPARPEPAIVTFIGMVYRAIKERNIKAVFEEAKRQRHRSVEDMGEWVDHVGFGHKVTYPRIQSQLKVMAPHALFFGAFCYNGVNFLFRPETLFAPCYATVMACCFVLSMLLVLTEGSISAKFVQLESDEPKKEFFARKVAYMLRGGYWVYKQVPTLFMWGIMLMGSVKLWLFDITSSTFCPIVHNVTFAPPCQQMYTSKNAEQITDSLTYGWIIFLGGFLGLLGTWTFRVYLQGRAFIASSKAKEMQEKKKNRRALRSEQARAELTEIDPYEDVKEDSEIRTASVLFQTGNVFYEVLFTVINPDRPFPNIVYLVFSVMTLALGCIALVIGGNISIWMDDLATKTAKSIFATEVQPCVNLLFRLYHFSLICWLMAMMASSAVKYPHHWYFSFTTSIAAIVLIHSSWVIILCKKGGLQEANPNSDGTRVHDISWRQLFKPVGDTIRAFFTVDGGGAQVSSAGVADGADAAMETELLRSATQMPCHDARECDSEPAWQDVGLLAIAK